MVRMIKERIGLDGFLGNMHTLLMMDDTVVVSTSRDKCIQKLETVIDYCNSYGMVINEKKTSQSRCCTQELNLDPLRLLPHINEFMQNCDQIIAYHFFFTM